MHGRTAGLLAVAIASMLMSVKTDAADEPVCSLERDPLGFDQRTLSLHGTVIELNETTSQRGHNYTTFKLQDPTGCAVKVFIWEHPKLSNGDCVTADGVFETEHHEGATRSVTSCRAVRSLLYLSSAVRAPSWPQEQYRRALLVHRYSVGNWLQLTEPVRWPGHLSVMSQSSTQLGQNGHVTDIIDPSRRREPTLIGTINWLSAPTPVRCRSVRAIWR